MVIVVVLPLPQFAVEQVNVVGDPVPIEQLIKLLIVDAVRSFDLAVEVRRPGPDIHVPDVELLEMPVELRLKFGAAVGLHDVDPKRESTPHLVNELDGRALIAPVIDLQHANSGAIVDGGELIEPPPRAGDALQELHVQLKPMPWLRLFV